MPRAKRLIEHEVTLNGHKLVWRLHREQQNSTVDGWVGVSIHVRVAEGTRKELYLEFPAVKTQKIGYTRTDHAILNIRAKVVEQSILLAMEHGWDPESRGKPFFFMLDEPPY